MWTRDCKDLVPGYYWYTYFLSDFMKERTTEVIRVLEKDKLHEYPETEEMADDCCGPSFYPADLEKEEAYIWSIPLPPPEYPSKEVVVFGSDDFRFDDVEF
ncbi:MAG: hypothetical protein ACTSX1_13290 [Candidatus Heimdallarchaeaceae archaeon]